MFASVEQVEAQLGKGGIVDIFSDRVRVKLAEELGEGGVTRRSV